MFKKKITISLQTSQLSLPATAWAAEEFNKNIEKEGTGQTQNVELSFSSVAQPFIRKASSWEPCEVMHGRSS